MFNSVQRGRLRSNIALIRSILPLLFVVLQTDYSALLVSAVGN